MRKLKITSLLAVFLVVIMLLVGCGADVSSVMNITTADGTFSGTRVITLLIENDDLSSVNGGIAGLETVLKENLPSDLTYTITNPSSTQTSIVFTLSFSSLDDYRTKVTNLLKADADNEIIPEICYEKQDTIFKSGLKYSENFESFDLIRWYYKALEAADIISESSSNWYEIGTNELIIDGESLDTSSEFYVDNQETRCFDNCVVRTIMNNDGTYDRTISFVAYEETKEILDDAAGNINEYMEKIATEDIKFEVVEDEDGRTEYIYSILDAKVEEIVKATNTVMKSESNTFSVDIQPKKDSAGVAVVTISESLDGSYYLDYDDNPLESYIVTYPNFDVYEDEENDFYLGYEGENEIYYYPYAGTTYSISGDWTVGYEKVELEVSASTTNDMDVKLTFTISDSLTEEIKDIAFSALKAACKDKGSYEKEGNVATYKVSGEPKEVVKSLNAFVKHYVVEDNSEGEEVQYCTVNLAEMGTASKLTNGIFGDFSLDLTPVLGNANINVTQSGATKVVSAHETNEQGELYTNSQIHLKFETTKLSYITLILLAFSLALFIGGVIICILNRKELMGLISAKKKEAPIITVAMESIVEQENEQVTEQTTEEEMVKAPVVVDESDEDDEEEEIL